MACDDGGVCMGSGIVLRQKAGQEICVPFSYLGVGLFLLWGFSVDFTDFFLFDQSHTNPLLCYYVSSATNACTLVACAVMSHRIRSLLGSVVPGCIGALCGTLGTVLMIVGGALTGAPGVAVAVAGALATGCGMAFMALVWMELFCKVEQDRMIPSYALGLGVFALGGIVVAAMGAVWLSIAALVALPLLSMAMAEACRRRLESEGAVSDFETVSDWTFPFKPVVLIAMCAVASRMAKALAPVEMGVLSTAGDFVVAVLVLAVFLVRTRKFDVRLLYRSALPLCAAGLLLGLIAFPHKSAVISVVSGAGFSCVVTFTTVLLCSMSYRYGVNPLWLFGISRAARVVAGFVGTACAQTVSNLGGQAPTVCAVVTTLLLIACFMVVLNEDDFRTTWGMSPRLSDSAPTGTVSAGEDRRALAFAQLERAHALTRRESEIAVLLVDGLDARQIEERLVISGGTVKVHLRHVYAKLGVHSREELIALYTRALERAE